MPSLDPPFGLIPAAPDQLTATWLATILTRHGFSAAIEGAIQFRAPTRSSLTSEVLGVVPRFQDETTGMTPPLLWKRSADDPQRREAFSSGYATEVAFYRDVAHTVDVLVPRCFAAAYEQTTGAHVLLLEDLLPSAPGDFVEGISPERAEAVLREFARLHATRWTDPPAPAQEIERLGRVGSSIERLAPLSAPYLTQHVDHRAAERTRRYAHEVEGLLSRLVAGPQTLVHGDAHPTNVIFPRPPAARPSLVDWQDSRIDAPLRDVARFLILGLTVEDWHASEGALFSSYLEHLQTNGAHYDAAAAALDYRAASMLEWGWVVRQCRHESRWDADTQAAMPTLVKRAAAAFDDMTSRLGPPEAR